MVAGSVLLGGDWCCRGVGRLLGELKNTQRTAPQESDDFRNNLMLK